MTSHPVGIEIETFLDRYQDILPSQFGMFQTHRDFWRALILTISDKYGYCTIKDLSMYDNHQIWATAFTRLIKKVHAENTKLRKVLALRMDTERVQIQRPLEGRSLLSITTSRSSIHSRALRTLCVLAIHPTLGVDGFRVKNYSDVPFLLPKRLQDKLPNIPSDIPDMDLSYPARKLTDFVETIYRARQFVQNDATNDSDASDDMRPFVTFIRQAHLHSDLVWQKLGELPSTFDREIHGFVIKVPYVIPGKQVILWNTWHATAGSTSKSPKVTAFIDLVPRRYFENVQNLEWYKYVSQHAPIDPGSGSGRGAYLSFHTKVVDDMNSGDGVIQYGLHDEYMEMFDNGLRHMAIDHADTRGHGTLTFEQKRSFHTDGYLIIDIPEHLVQLLPAEKSLENFNRFFRNISGKSSFSLDVHLHQVIDQKLAEEETGSQYTYYSNRIDETDPLNPFKNGVKSRNAQKGGKLIAKNCGMGKGTTYVSEPFHVSFQYSQFVYNILKSFYHPGAIEPLVVVNERFRAKTTSSWANGTHIDTAAVKLIPDVFHVYRQANNLPAFR